MKERKVIGWIFRLICYCFLLVSYAAIMLWRNYSAVEEDWQLIKYLQVWDYEPSNIVQVLLGEKLELFYDRFWLWISIHWVCVPFLIFSLISTARLVQPYWWLGLWIERVNTNGDLLEERLKSYSEVSLPESVALCFKSLSLDAQSSLIRRLVKRVHRKYRTNAGQ